MKDDDAGEIMTPHRTRVLVSPDKLTLALRFDGLDRPPMTILLPLMAAADLRDRLVETLDTLGVGRGGTQHTPGLPN